MKTNNNGSGSDGNSHQKQTDCLIEMLLTVVVVPLLLYQCHDDVTLVEWLVLCAVCFVQEREGSNKRMNVCLHLHYSVLRPVSWS